MVSTTTSTAASIIDDNCDGTDPVDPIDPEQPTTTTTGPGRRRCPTSTTDVTAAASGTPW
jgi:hypothetical protein